MGVVRTKQVTVYTFFACSGFHHFLVCIVWLGVIKINPLCFWRRKKILTASESIYPNLFWQQPGILPASKPQKSPSVNSTSKNWLALSREWGLIPSFPTKGQLEKSNLTCLFQSSLKFGALWNRPIHPNLTPSKPFHRSFPTRHDTGRPINIASPWWMSLRCRVLRLHRNWMFWVPKPKLQDIGPSWRRLVGLDLGCWVGFGGEGFWLVGVGGCGWGWIFGGGWDWIFFCWPSTTSNKLINGGQVV